MAKASKSIFRRRLAMIRTPRSPPVDLNDLWVVPATACEDLLRVARAWGIPFLPIGALFDGITRNPAAPEYWWVYALLLATMSPSLINLMIGGASLIAGAPGLPSLLLRFMPDGKAVPVFDR